VSFRRTVSGGQLQIASKNTVPLNLQHFSMFNMFNLVLWTNANAGDEVDDPRDG
jgi:hypothetical protein